MDKGRLARRGSLFLLFLLSGFSGLVFEIVWVRLASLALGVTIYAVSVVVSAFMAGLALGGYLAGKFADERQLGVKAYATLELLICVTGLGATWLLSGLQQFIGKSYFGDLVLLEALLAGLILLLPCTLMGATVPVLSRAVFDPKAPGTMIGWLYGANVVGAVAGALMADFLLIPNIGVTVAAMVAGAGNALAGTVGYALSGGLDRASRAPAQEGKEVETRVRFLYGAYAASGFCALALQVVWVRLLVVLLDSSIYAFSVNLATYLAAMAFGTMLASPLAARVKNHSLWVFATLLAISLTSLLSVSAFGPLETAIQTHPPRNLARFLDSVTTTGFGWMMLLSVYRSLVLFGLPTFLMGFLFPFVCEVALKLGSGVGGPVGKLYSSNTVGGILGSLAGGFILLPSLGVQRSIGVLCLLLLVSTGLTLPLIETTRSKLAKLSLVVGLLACLGYLSLDQGWLFQNINLKHYERTYNIKPEQIKHTEEDIYGTVAIALGTGSGDALLVNGTHMMGSALPVRRYACLMAHLPLAIIEKPKKALVICFGLGMTFGAVSTHDELTSAHCVELSPAVLRAASYFERHNFGVAEKLDENVSVTIGDGRNFLLRSDQEFDLITFEPPPPNAPGVVNLYSADYYRLCRSKLSDRGLVCQWLPVHTVTERSSAMIVRTFLEVFPEATLWEGSSRELLLIGGKGPIEVDFANFQQAAQRPGMKEIGINDEYDLLSCFLQGPESLKAYASSAPVVSDNHPYLEYEFGPPALAPQIQRRDLDELLQTVDGMDESQTRSLVARAQSMDTLNEIRSPAQSHPAVAVLSRFLKIREIQSQHQGNVYVQYSVGVSPDYIQLLKQTVSRNPSWPNARNLAFALLLNRQYDEALRLLEFLREQEPQSPVPSLFMGLAEDEQGRSPEQFFQEALSKIKEPSVRGEVEELLKQAALAHPQLP